MKGAGGLTFTLEAKDLERIGDRFGAMAGKAPVSLARAINHTGMKARTAMVRAMPGQTGLKRDTIVRALKVNKAGGGLTFSIASRGGNVSLKHFRARETARGVSAAPWNRRSVYAHSFMKAGWWPRRVEKSNWNGQVFERAGSVTGNLRAGSKTRRMDRFEKIKSGLFIPDEMVKDASAAAFKGIVEADLPKRLEHELARLLG